MKICLAELDISILFQERFNKIAIQGTPQMTVDKEAISLSRVYSSSSSSCVCAGQHFMSHYRTLEVRLGRIS